MTMISLISSRLRIASTILLHSHHRHNHHHTLANVPAIPITPLAAPTAMGRIQNPRINPIPTFPPIPRFPSPGTTSLPVIRTRQIHREQPPKGDKNSAQKLKELKETIESFRINFMRRIEEEYNRFVVVYAPKLDKIVKYYNRTGAFLQNTLLYASIVYGVYLYVVNKYDIALLNKLRKEDGETEMEAMKRFVGKVLEKQAEANREHITLLLQKLYRQQQIESSTENFLLHDMSVYYLFPEAIDFYRYQKKDADATEGVQDADAVEGVQDAGNKAIQTNTVQGTTFGDRLRMWCDFLAVRLEECAEPQRNDKLKHCEMYVKLYPTTCEAPKDSGA